MKIQLINKKQINFKSVYYENYNSKYSNIRSKLERETERFFQNSSNVKKIGEGVNGETYKFSDWDLRKFVIKTTKPNCTDDYNKEYTNLMGIPVDKIGGQEAVARVYDSSKGRYGLISTMVEGKPASIINKYNDVHLRILFDKMFELDKSGIYHGDLNGNNILLNSSGNVNFIDYQWTQFVSKSNFYDMEKVKKMLLPKTVFPENAQMFEMASLPYYIEKLPSSYEKESFLKKYLKNKSYYHDKRAKFIAALVPNWYASEKHLIQQSQREESAKAKVLKNPDDSVIKLELKKIQFLSDYRDAYSHVDGNLPNRNIIPSSSAYLCAMSSVQDFRKEVSKEMNKCYNSDKREYLRSLQIYGDYWYSNLKEYTYDTFNYVMRALINKPGREEVKHQFYINERNPRYISPNRDILKNVSPKYQTVFDRNFDVPIGMSYKIPDIYDDAACTIGNLLSYDTKSQHNIDKIRSVSKESKAFNNESRFLDLLNVSLVGVLKIREFAGYVRHNLPAYLAASYITDLLEKTSEFTLSLFNTMYNGLRQETSNNILTKGYIGMRQFKGKI